MIKVIRNILTIFFMTALSFVIFLVSMLYLGFYHQELFMDGTNTCNYYCGILILNIIIFIIVIFNTTLESIETFKISPFYALLCPIGSLFLIIVFHSNIIPVLLPISKIYSKKQ
jgi:hypothetical protein